MKKDGGPAFPNTITSEPEGRLFPEGFGYGGMSLRDYFAGQMLNAIASSDEGSAKVFEIAKYNSIPSSEAAAIMAYAQADAMLEERNKK